MSENSENTAPSDKVDKPRTARGRRISNNNKSVTAPAFLNTSFAGKNVTLAPPSVLRPVKRQESETGTSGQETTPIRDSGPARRKLQALIAKYERC